MTATALEEKLRALFDEYEMAFADYAWASEKERWGELLYCLLASLDGASRERARHVVVLLAEVGLLEPERLARAHDAPTAQEAVVVRAILQAQGFDGARGDDALRLLGAAARFVHAEHQGRIQRFLRRYGEQMAEDLARPLEASGAPKGVAAHAVRWWLQNACGMPVSLAQPAVRRFCEANGAGVDDLLAAADRLDVNVAVVDDLLEVVERKDAPPQPVPLA